jgi:hypothetical protein
MGLIQTELDSVETGIELFKKANPMASLSIAGTDLLNDLKASDQKLSELDLQMSLLNDIDKYLQGNGKKPGMLPSFAGMQFGTEIQQFLLKLYDAELEHEKFKLTTAPQSEQYILAEERLSTIRGTVKEFVYNVRNNLVAIRAQAQREADKFSGIIASMPAQERKLFDINRQQGIKNSLFTYLLQKREESAIRAAATNSDLLLLEPPQYSSTPVNTKPTLNYAIGLMGGIGLVILVLFLINILNNKLISRGQIEALTKIPVLGVIAQSKDEGHLVMTGHARTAIAEQFRALRDRKSVV